MQGICAIFKKICHSLSDGNDGKTDFPTFTDPSIFAEEILWLISNTRTIRRKRG